MGISTDNCLPKFPRIDAALQRYSVSQALRGTRASPMPDAQRAPHVTEKGYKYQFKAGVVPSTGRTIAGLLVAFG